MLYLTIPASEMYDERTNLFTQYPPTTLQLEHSLLSIAKWESTHCKPFMTKEQKTPEEFLDYIRCMTINSHVDPSVYMRLGRKEFEKIQAYIEAPMTATTFYNLDKNKKPNRETITSELVYYWMTTAQIPFDPCEKWHFNRLMTLIRIYDVKNDKTKMSKKDTRRHYSAINAARRAKYGSKG